MPIAAATKIFWKKYLSHTSFKHKIELGKIPVNCQFLQPKRKNVEIWSVILPSSRSRVKGIQDIQTITAASASLIIQASTHMSQYLAVTSKKSGGKIDIMPPLTEIKDHLSLSEKINQELNQLGGT